MNSSNVKLSEWKLVDIDLNAFLIFLIKYPMLRLLTMTQRKHFDKKLENISELVGFTKDLFLVCPSSIYN